MKRLLIIGAGEAGKMVAHEIKAHSAFKKTYTLLGFCDDDTVKQEVLSFPVLGTIADIPDIVTSYKITDVIIAIPSAKKSLISRIFDLLPLDSIEVKIVPGIFEIIEGKVSLNQIREISPVDLLGREEINFNKEILIPYYKNKTILITGGGGSIGSELIRQLLYLPVKKVIAFGHGENSLYLLINQFKNEPRFAYQIGDILDYEKLIHVFQSFNVDMVFHAAAHKHVPLMELHPDEALRNNIIGTYTCIEAAKTSGVKEFVYISTDKAVNPTSVMGASKRAAEKIVLSYASQIEGFRVTVTRFGNVLGSRGSVVPLFQEQINNVQAITVTHPDITRFFMSIGEAARLVIKAATVKDGSLYILDMGEQIKIIDLARMMIKLNGYTEDDIPIKITGLRPGEKLYEELAGHDEEVYPTQFEKLQMVKICSSDLKYDDLEKWIKETKKVIHFYDIKKIKQFLKKLVPEYTQL